MIKHVVAFKLKENESKEQAANVLKSMQGVVPQIKTLEVGIDILCSKRSYDVVLIVTVDDEVALEAYQKDPYHCDVVKKYMDDKSIDTISVDFCVFD